MAAKKKTAARKRLAVGDTAPSTFVVWARKPYPGKATDGSKLGGRARVAVYTNFDLPTRRFWRFEAFVQTLAALKGLRVILVSPFTSNINSFVGTSKKVHEFFDHPEGGIGGDSRQFARAYGLKDAGVTAVFVIDKTDTITHLQVSAGTLKLDFNAAVAAASELTKRPSSS